MENFDDRGCQKTSKLLENDDTDLDCSRNNLYRHKKTLHCAEGLRLRDKEFIFLNNI